MTVVISLFLITHILAIGYLLERLPRFFRARVCAGVFVYFVAAYIGLAFLLRVFPDWIVPQMG